MRAIFSAIVLSTLPLSVAVADEHVRQLDAHVHGESRLDIALEGDTLSMRLEAPAMDIVGFEHAPSTDEQKHAIEQARTLLSKPLELFRHSADADCAVVSAEVEHNFGEDHADEDHAHDDGHAHEDHSEHAHEKDHEHGAEHAHKGEHAHKDDHGHEEHAGHSEFEASYQLVCASPGRIGDMEFVFFDRFPNAQEVHVQAIGPNGQSAYDVERSAPRISLTDVNS